MRAFGTPERPTTGAVGLTWDEIKTGIAVVKFGACLVVSAGSCVIVGIAGAPVAYGGDWAITGEFDRADYLRSIAWTVGG